MSCKISFRFRISVLEFSDVNLHNECQKEACSNNRSLNPYINCKRSSLCKMCSRVKMHITSVEHYMGRKYSMKKILSILATIMGALYLAAGIGLLVFQDVVKAVIGYGADQGFDMPNVYPVQNVLELVLLGIPCVVLGILSMSESSDHKRKVDLLLVIYSGAMLVLGGALATIGGFLSNWIVSRTMGVEGIVGMSIISGAFNWIHFLINLSLVLLLLRGALSLGKSV